MDQLEALVTARFWLGSALAFFVGVALWNLLPGNSSLVNSGVAGFLAFAIWGVLEIWSWSPHG